MNSRTITAIVVAVIIIGGGIWLATRSSAPTPDTATPAPVTSGTTGTDTTGTSGGTGGSSSASGYTASDVAAHASASDCWTIVDGKVYNITSFIPSHPGGPAIIQACGKDGSSLFHSVPQHDRVNAQATLDQYFIGNLKS